MNVYEIITNKIIERVEAGQPLPWQRPWDRKNGIPQNLITRKPYRGINVFLTAGQGYSSPFWLTFKQAQSLGGSVRKGEKSTPCVFWQFLEKENEEGKTQKIPMLRYYQIFNLAQIDGIEAPAGEAAEIHDFSPIAEAAAIVDGMPQCPSIKHAYDRAFYSPVVDFVGMPSPEQFHTPAEYYSTLFHELGHSTGHESRLNRKTLTATIQKGDQNYSKEELVAEFTAAFLCSFSGIEATFDNSSAYIQGWLKALKNDSKMLVMAAAAGQKASDFILGVSTDLEAVTE